MQLGLKDQEQAEGEDESAEDAGLPDSGRQGKQRAKPKRNRGHLPKYPPRIERIIEPEEKPCPCCAGEMHVIAEDRSRQLDIIPAKLQVIVTRRPRYGWAIPRASRRSVLTIIADSAAFT
jgi:transposase